MKTHKIRNIVILFLAFLMISVFFLGHSSQSAAGSRKSVKIEYTSQIGTFSAEMTLKKSTVFFNSTVEASVTFKNLTEKALCIEFPGWAHPGNNNESAGFENLLNFWVTKDAKPAYLSTLVIPRYGIMLEKDAVISCTKEYRVTERGVNDAFLDIVFYAGEKFCDCKNPLKNLWTDHENDVLCECMETVHMQTEPINITVI